MKFRYYLESITGIGIYPLMSLFLFLVFFLAMFTWIMLVDKKYINSMKQLPFGND